METQLDVYALQIPENAVYYDYDDLLVEVSPEKAARIQEFRFNGDRMRSLLGDLLLRYLIMKRTGIANREIRYCFNDYDKPFLAGRDDCYFNLSHAGEWVVAAIDSQPVGIDVEKCQDFDVELSQHIFTPKEHADIMSHDDKADYFFSLWVLKEAFIKMLGKGTTYPLNAFCIKSSQEEDQPKRLGLIQSRVELEERGHAVEGVYFVRYQIAENYKLGVCARHDRFPSTCTQMDIHRLARKFRDQRTRETS